MAKKPPGLVERIELRPWSRLVPDLDPGPPGGSPGKQAGSCAASISSCPRLLAAGRFCWKQECGNSKVLLPPPHDPQEHKARACRFVVQEGMRITVLSAELKHVLRDILKRPPDEDQPLPESPPRTIPHHLRSSRRNHPPVTTPRFVNDS